MRWISPWQMSTPGWHSKSGKLIAVGAQVRYDKKGTQLDDKPQSAPDSVRGVRSEDPDVDAVEDDSHACQGRSSDFARSACAQWLEMDDGTVLLPFYYGPNATAPHSVTVARFRFDGRELTYLQHGSEHELKVVRGLEPSVVKYAGRYFLTVRNDLKGYVTVSNDGLQYQPLKEWTFEDGGELGSYNTQQHWLAHSDGLFLAYTRKGANNDHVSPTSGSAVSCAGETREVAGGAEDGENPAAGAWGDIWELWGSGDDGRRVVGDGCGGGDVFEGGEGARGTRTVAGGAGPCGGSRTG